MARRFAPLYTSIWQEADFVALAPASQALYFTLISQPNINSVGLLPITQRRWRGCAAWTVEAFDEAMAALVEARFVMVDEDTEELLIRTFVKWDGGANHPLRAKAIIKDAQAIQSAPLRRFIAGEIATLGLAQGTLKPPPSDSDALTEATEVPTVPILTLRTKQRNQEPGTLNPEPGEGEPPTSGPATPQQDFCDKHMPDGTDEPCGRCAGIRKRNERQLTAREQRQAAEKSRLADIRAKCAECNATGWVEDSEGKPVRRCGHPKLQSQSRRTA